MAAFWNQGTITLETDSAEVAGQGTDFNMSTLRAGDTIESDDGRRATILSINAADGDGAITLDKPWRGAGQIEAPYKGWFTPDDVVLEGLGRKALSALASGNLQALAGIAGVADNVAYFTGDGTMDKTALTALGRDIIGADDEEAAQTALGGTTVGRGVFGAANAVAAQTALGGSAVGRDVFVATDGAAARTAMGASLLGGTRNLLINALGTINQRGYTSGAATSGANQYTIDRWRVVTSGQSLSWTQSSGIRTMTAPDGGLEQVVAGGAVISDQYVLNWDGTATATVNGVARAKGAAFSLTGGSNVTVRFSNGTFSRPQLERGSSPTEFEVRQPQQERDFCREYYRPAQLLRFKLNYLHTGNALYSVSFYHEGMRSPPSYVLSGAEVFTSVSALTSVATANMDVTAAGDANITRVTALYVGAGATAGFFVIIALDAEF